MVRGRMGGWRRVNVPAPITETIDRLKKRLDEPRWRVIARALLTYASVHDDLDRRLYYVNKLLTGWTYVKVYMTLYREGRVTGDEVSAQVRRFARTLTQVQDRLHIKTVHLLSLLDALAQGADGRKVAVINDELREVIKGILVSSVEG